MCEVKDYKTLKLSEESRDYLKSLNVWHSLFLLGKNETVLDLGAGEGETAMFYLLHGARRMICVECDKRKFKVLKENRRRMLKLFPKAKIQLIFARVDKVKSDIEGGEENMVIETHFPHRFVRYPQFWNRGTYSQRFYQWLSGQDYTVLRRKPAAIEHYMTMLEYM
jgi:predicted methyltransferase